MYVGCVSRSRANMRCGWMWWLLCARSACICVPDNFTSFSPWTWSNSFGKLCDPLHVKHAFLHIPTNKWWNYGRIPLHHSPTTSAGNLLGQRLLGAWISPNTCDTSWGTLGHSLIPKACKVSSVILLMDVNGRNPAPGMFFKKSVQNRINYQPQLVRSRTSSINSSTSPCSACSRSLPLQVPPQPCACPGQ